MGNSLKKAVLERDLSLVRSICKSHPDYLEQKTSSGKSIYELARAAGNFRILLTLARYGNKEDYLNEFAKSIITGFISEVSDDYFCAGWMDGIEHSLYEISQGQVPTRVFNPESHRIPDDEDAKDISFLIISTKKWAIFEEDIHVISLEAYKSKRSNMQ